MEKYGVPGDRILVAHDGVDVERYERFRGINKQALRKELGLPVGQTVIVHAGSMYEGRGLELFEVAASAFKDIHCVGVGGRPEDVRRMKERFRNYDNVVFVGHKQQDEVARYELAADLLFLPMTRRNPIWWCSSPLKLFEYMATGRPILASVIGGVSEILNESRALVFDPDHPESLLRRICEFRQDPGGAEAKAADALKLTRQSYTWDKRAQRILEFARTDILQAEKPYAGRGTRMRGA